jgi:hypothetical protein
MLNQKKASGLDLITTRMIKGLSKEGSQASTNAVKHSYEYFVLLRGVFT